ncbi:MAG: hypothetical protein IT460_03525 [Planctomycetes bacterium]|nr:hypothetical protein [Planctomycetota bacterium]
MRQAPDDALLAVLAETNDLRRDVGRVLTALHRALVLWRDRGRSFATVVRTFAPGAVQLLERSERRLRRLAPHGRDEPLRRFAAGVLTTLAEDLAAGDARFVPHLRTLEARLAELAALLRATDRAAPVHDLAAARDLRRALAACAGADRHGAAATLRSVAADLVGS